MAFGASRLGFHKNGRPRRWMRKLLVDKNGDLRPISRRMVMKKNGKVRAQHVGWFRPPVLETVPAPLPPEPKTVQSWLSDRWQALNPLTMFPEVSGHPPSDYACDRQCGSIQPVWRSRNGAYHGGAVGRAYWIGFADCDADRTSGDDGAVQCSGGKWFKIFRSRRIPPCASRWIS